MFLFSVALLVFIVCVSYLSAVMLPWILICAHVDLGFVRIRRLHWIDLQGVPFALPWIPLQIRRSPIVVKVNSF